MSNIQNLVINQDQKEIFINFFKVLKTFIIKNHLSEVPKISGETVEELYERLLKGEIFLPQNIGSYVARYQELKEELSNNKNEQINILNDDINKIKDNLAELSYQLEVKTIEINEEGRNAIDEISKLIGFDQDSNDEGLDNKYFMLYKKYKLKYLNLKKSLF
jgi:predicted transcriptional regulator